MLSSWYLLLSFIFNFFPLVFIWLDPDLDLYGHLWDAGSGSALYCMRIRITGYMYGDCMEYFFYKAQLVTR